jgi:hypothetical protein
MQLEKTLIKPIEILLVFKNISNKTDPCMAVNDSLSFIETKNLENIPSVTDPSKTGVNER